MNDIAIAKLSRKLPEPLNGRGSDMRGAQAEDFAEAHRKDIEIQDKPEVKYMAYRFDHEHGAGFCLVRAPDAATAERVHRDAHREIANAFIPVDPAAVEAFLGRIGDPRTATGALVPVVDSGLDRKS